jgi:hypothetical protein
MMVVILILAVLCPVAFIGGFLVGCKSVMDSFRASREVMGEVKINEVVRMTPLKKALATLDTEDAKKLHGLSIHDIKKIDSIRRSHR